LCAEAFSFPYTFLQTEGDFSGKGFDQIAHAIRSTNANMVLNTTAPSEPGSLNRLVELCSNNKIYFVTQNNLPSSDLRPWHFGPYYVAHIDFDHKLAGLKTGRLLLTAMGDRGGVIVLSGKSDSPVARQRLAGFEEALANAPHAYKLAPPTDAEWEASASYDITRSLIAQHGAERVSGIWAANDEMALGAVEALRLYQHSVPVTGMDGTPEAISSIQAGTMVGTVAWDSFWQGGIGLALATSAKAGIFSPSKEPNSHRAFYGPISLVTADNVRNFVGYRDADRPLIYWRDFWGQSTGAIAEK
jgi:ribose transport system substrate-binding protein